MEAAGREGRRKRWKEVGKAEAKINVWKEGEYEGEEKEEEEGKNKETSKGTWDYVLSEGL